MTSVCRSAILIAVICSLFLCHANELPAINQVITLACSDDSADLFAEIDTVIQEPFVLERLTFTADVQVQEFEFLYLVGIRENQTVSAQDLKRACSYLAKKRKFAAITLEIEPGIEGKRIHFDMQSQVTFRTLIFHGMLLGKDTYRRFYVLEPGDLFDCAKHEHALKKMKEAFHQQGYFNATVTDRIDLDEATKSVSVHIWLSAGSRFVIDQVDLSLNLPADEVGIGSAERMRKDIDALFTHAIQGSFYTKELFETKIHDLKRLLAQQGYVNPSVELAEHIDYRRRTMKFSVVIALYKKKEFIFFGNHFYTSEELLDKVLMFGKAAWLLPPVLLAQELVQSYHKKGFWDVQIDPQDEADRYFFLINEGDRASIEQVVLKGVTSFDAKRLTRRFFSRFLRKRYFDEQLLTTELHKLIAFYRTHGFVESKILQKNFVRQKGNRYTLELTIDEGVQRRIASVTIPDYPELERKGPFAVYADLRESLVFDAHVLDEQRRWLVRHFQDQGYLYVRVHSEVSEEDGVSTVIWHVDLVTEKVRFGKTILVGSTTLPFRMLLTELCYQEGDVWDKKKLNESLVRLRELALFKQVHLYPEQLAVPEEEKVIMLKVIKDEPFEVRLRGGLGLHRVGDRSIVLGSPTYKLGGSLVYKDPLGVGDQLRLDTDFTLTHRKFELTYSRPWLHTIPLRTNFKGYLNKYGHPGFIIERKNLYEVTQEGFLCGVQGKRLQLTYGVDIGLEWMKTTVKEDNIGINNLVARLSEAIYLSPGIIDQKVPYIVVEPNMFLDYLDDKLNPTCGSLTVFSCKAMFPVDRSNISSYFVKVQCEHSRFFPLLPSMTLGVRVRAGHIFNQMFNEIMPTERFYLGGANSVRGYQTDLAPPVGVFVDDDGQEHTVPQGGKTMVNLNVEGRFAVYKGLGLVIFQDVGLLIEDELSVSIGDRLVAATGVGLRYNTPVGPLRFDIGLKWHKAQPDDPRYAWFLAFGHAF